MGLPLWLFARFSRGVAGAKRSDIGFVTPLPGGLYPRLRRTFIAHLATQVGPMFCLFAVYVACLSWDQNTLLRYCLGSLCLFGHRLSADILCTSGIGIWGVVGPFIVWYPWLHCPVAACCRIVLGGS